MVTRPPATVIEHREKVPGKGTAGRGGLPPIGRRIIPRSAVTGLAALGIAATAFFGLRMQAYAHVQPVNLTEVSFSAPGVDDCSPVFTPCHIEIIHRFSLHVIIGHIDPGKLADMPQESVPAQNDSVISRPMQRMLERHVADHFRLRNATTGQEINLTVLGGELDGGYYRVYQEGMTGPDTYRLDLLNTILINEVPNQINRVNIYHENRVQTLVFSAASDHMQSVDLHE